MKVRHGFVSNSSSSSFVISKDRVTDEQWDLLCQKMHDAGIYSDEKNGYMFVDTSDAMSPSEFADELGIPSTAFADFYG